MRTAENGERSVQGRIDAFVRSYVYICYMLYMLRPKMSMRWWSPHQAVKVVVVQSEVGRLASVDQLVFGQLEIWDLGLGREVGVGISTGMPARIAV